MKDFTFLDNIDASVSQISEPLNLEQRTAWKIRITSNNLNGIPKLYIEEGFNLGECHPLPTEWFLIGDKCSENGAFLINDGAITIEKGDIGGNWMRVRYENEDNTSGNLTVKIGYKTFT